MTYDERLKTTWPAVAERIAEAGRRARRTDPVVVVAVTKTHPVEAVIAARAAGLRACGENRLQELAEKHAQLGGAADVEWHLIGHLQRNKVRQALPLCHLIHSVDSERIAREISDEAVRQERHVDVLVQVNASGEETKGGFPVETAADAAHVVAGLPNMNVRGLMTMAPFTDDEHVLRAAFGATRAAFERCAREVPGFHAEHLSMGMSNDFEIAIEEGATMVRLGTVLFGERQR